MKTRIYSTLTAWLVQPRLPLHLALLAMLLTLPALGIGWQLDDHFHRLMMLGSPEFEYRPFEVFSALRDDSQLIREYIDAGVFPWWTIPDFHLAFFRYLSAFSMWIDYQLWPNTPALMHMHSLLWYAALVAAATFFYRRLLGASWCAGLAALLYAVDEAHAAPVAWLANRNALLATVFGLLCLLAHDQWRKKGSKGGAILSPIFLGVALCCGEMGVATAGYLLAYAVFLDRAKWHRRLTALSAHTLVLVAWAIIYRIFGFGTFGSDYYQDPLGRPAAFLGALFSRAPVLFLGQWSPLGADWAMLFSEDAFRRFWLAGIAVIVLMISLFTPLVRRDRMARFWTLGMLLSLVPVSAVAPSNRLLFFVGLGAMGLLAQLVSGFVEGGHWMPRRRAWRLPAGALTGLLVIVHLGIAPLSTPILAYSLKPFGEPMVQAIAGVPDDPVIAEQDLVLVNPPDHLFLVSPIPTLKILNGRPYPRRLRTLVTGSSPLEVTRLTERALRVRTEQGIYSGTLGRLFRSRYDPMSAGQRFELTGMTVEIMRTDAHGGPVELEFTFSVPLEDSSLRWLRWEGEGYVPFKPPPIGQTVALAPSYGPMDVFRRPSASPLTQRPSPNLS
jgi:hypothetical protein